MTNGRSPFGDKPEPFKSVGRKNNDDAHANSDVDTDRSAQHHTLGPSPLQAAPGNHTHKATYTLTTDTIPDLPNIGSWTKNWTRLFIDGHRINYKGKITLNAGWGGTAYLSLPVPPVVMPVGLENNIGAGFILRNTVAFVPFHVYLDTSTAGYGRAAFFTINPIAFLTGNVPYTFAAGDVMGWDVTYYRAAS